MLRTLSSSVQGLLLLFIWNMHCALRDIHAVPTNFYVCMLYVNMQTWPRPRREIIDGQMGNDADDDRSYW